MYTFLSIEVTTGEDVSEPLSLSDAKDWLNVDHGEDDNLIAQMISGARQDVEKQTGLALVQKTVVALIEMTTPGRVPLPYGMPSNVTVRDSQGEEVDADQYSLIGSSLRINSAGEYEVGYTTGGTTQALNELVMQTVAFRYNNRGDAAAEVPQDIKERTAKHAGAWL